jgi:protein-S-isoprenylcysteine O-methyltransferase Ste14
VIESPVFLYDEAILFWMAFIWVFIPEIHHSGILAGAPSNPQDGGTLRLINLASDAALLAAFLLSFLPWYAIPYPRMALWLGTSLLVAGGLLRRICFRTLGKYFSAAVTVTPDQPLIESGPYRWVRHPGYSAGLIIFLGVGLALANWLALSILGMTTVYVYYRRVTAEEKALRDTIGESYIPYSKRTKRFIPFIF